jgi:hypothetical protein
MWRASVLHAAECAMLLGQYECAGRLLNADAPDQGADAAERTEAASQAVVSAALLMMRRGRTARELRLLAEAAEHARRAAFEARIDCVLAAVNDDP